MSHETAMEKLRKAAEAQGFLNAIKMVSKITQATGHPMESETLDRIYEAMETAYVEAYR